MCGRNSLIDSRPVIEERFDATIATEAYAPRYNIAPGAPLEVITNNAPESIDRYQWGLIPSWGDGPSDGLINARSETAAETPAFAHAWDRRPCLVLSSGFYEWRATTGGSKRPYRIYRTDDAAFAFAGLWDVWDGGAESVACVTILTTDANECVEPIHDRMPVILDDADERTWLDAGPDERAELCQPYPGDDLATVEISTRVNDPANDDPSVIEPLGHDQAGLGEFSSG